ncbi:MAG: hypothetical protein PW790_04795 [Parvibaculaceae bacterium]|nr:hypothetical protein [Parvibaculaceae bacterium]
MRIFPDWKSIFDPAKWLITIFLLMASMGAGLLINFILNNNTGPIAWKPDQTQAIRLAPVPLPSSPRRMARGPGPMVTPAPRPIGKLSAQERRKAYAACGAEPVPANANDRSFWKQMTACLAKRGLEIGGGR